MVLLRNVTPDSDRIKPVQPGFLAASATTIAQYPATADNENVRDQLFVTFVLFGVTSVQVQSIRRGGHHGQVFVDCEAKALKHAEFLEQFPFKAKHSFFGCYSPFHVVVLDNHYEPRLPRAKSMFFVNPLFRRLFTFANLPWSSSRSVPDST